VISTDECSKPQVGRRRRPKPTRTGPGHSFPIRQLPFLRPAVVGFPTSEGSLAGRTGPRGPSTREPQTRPGLLDSRNPDRQRHAACHIALDLAFLGRWVLVSQRWPTTVGFRIDFGQTGNLHSTRPPVRGVGHLHAPPPPPPSSHPPIPSHHPRGCCNNGRAIPAPILSSANELVREGH